MDKAFKIDLQRLRKNGRILDLTVPKGQIKVPEMNKLENFVDHRVYADGNFAYDPRYSKKLRGPV